MSSRDKIAQQGEKVSRPIAIDAMTRVSECSSPWPFFGNFTAFLGLLQKTAPRASLSNNRPHTFPVLGHT
jgi:hypothetical protein